jgi:hypothetical protein
VTVPSTSASTEAPVTTTIDSLDTTTLFSAEVSAEVAGKPKSPFIIIPVGETPNYKMETLNDVIKMSKEYPNLFPQGLDFSKLKTKEDGSGSSVYYDPGVAAAQQPWPYNAWFQPPVYANPYYPPPPPPPSPVYAPHPGINQTNQYFPYPTYPYGSWGVNGTSNPYSGWYEWAYGSQAGQNSSSQVPSSTEAPTTSKPSTISSTAAPTLKDTQPVSSASTSHPTTIHVKEVERITTKVFNPQSQTTTPASDIDLKKESSSTPGEAPAIQVYIVQGPNGPQVQTKTANIKDGSKAPNVQVYVIDENSKDNSNEKVISGGYGSRTKPVSSSGNQYYQYSHNHHSGVSYQSDESQLNAKTTLPPEYNIDDVEEEVYRASSPTPSRKQHKNRISSHKIEEHHQIDDIVPLEVSTRKPVRVSNNKNAVKVEKQETTKAPSLQSIYNSIGLKNFTDGLVPEAACTRPGLFQHPNDCNKFYECYFDRFVNGYTVHLFECPVKLAFDSRIIGCTGPTDPTVCVQY